MKRRLALLLSGLALAACSEPEPSETEQSASLAQPLPGDPICKWLPATPTQLPTAPARRFTGLASSRTGASLAAGDLNGDGIPELVIGAPGISTTTTLKGYAHIVPLVPPATLPQTNLLDIRSFSTRYEGEAAINRLGSAVAVGDFVAGTANDLLMGASGFSSAQGNAYPVDGNTIFGGDRLLTAASPRFRGSTLTPEQAGSALAIGDINGDGQADVIVGAPFYKSTIETGAVYAFTGPVTPTSSGQLSSASIKVMGGLSPGGAQAGSSLAVLDMNGDGHKDLVVGAPRHDTGSVADTGAVFIFYGPLSGLQGFNSATITLTGAVANELAGSSVANAGDLDNDGQEDLLIGAPGTGVSPGKTYVVYGGTFAPSPTSYSLAAEPRFTGIAQDLAGTAVLSPGDINGDGYKDLLIGAPGHTSNQGAVYAVYGTGARYSGNAALATTAGRLVGAAAGSELGRSLVALGDVDADGSADFAVGAPGFSASAGAVYLMLGHGPRTWYVDNDGDNFGTSAGSTRTCGEPAAGSKRALTEGDCDDAINTVYPGAPELCEATPAAEIDNNCDGLKGDEPGNNPLNPKDWVLDQDGDRAVYLNTAQQRCAPPASTGWIEYTPDVGFECDAPAGNPDPTYSTDNDASIYVGAPEICDLKDNDCDGAVDDNQSHWPSWYPDADGDSFGRSNATEVKACVAPPGHVANKTDCDDTSNSTYPGASEVCDLKDNNCNGTVDEGVQTTYYRDADGDGHGVPTATTQACTRPAGYAAVSDDCNDVGPNGARMYPGAAEVCDGLDNNCNFDTDEGVKSTFYRDVDGDGFGNPTAFVVACTASAGHVANNQDCDDSRAGVRPGAAEVCDGRDNNCDGTVDEGVMNAWYPDADGDGVGTTNETFRVLACTAPAGYVSSHVDCHDGNATVKPGAPELCDSLDNDCDGQVDEGIATTSWYPDADGDGYGNGAVSAVASCASPGPGYVSNRSDCNDSNANISPAQAEVCEQTGPQVDNNCDGNTENAVNGTVWYRDVDGDGFGTSTDTLKRCVRPAGYVAADKDCNDTNANVNPGRAEVCEAGAFSDQVDNDCDGDKNDVDPELPAGSGGTRLWYGDADNDGHAGPGFKLRWCVNPTNLVDPATGNVLVQGTYLATEPDDCNDAHSGVFQRLIWYEDRDGDGCGNPLTGREACGSPAGCGFPFVTNNKDTSDSNAADCRP